MNCAQALDLLMSRLGNRTEATLRATCLLEMTLVQQTALEGGSHLPWFLEQVLTNAQTPSDGVTRTLALPAGFLREVDRTALFIKDSEGAEHPCVKDDYEILADKHGLDATDDLPTDYAIVGGNIHFFPIPTVARDLRQVYYIRDDAPTDSQLSENLWLTHAADLLIAETGIVMATQHLQNLELGTTFAGMQTRARERLFKSSVAREEGGRSRAAGDD